MKIYFAGSIRGGREKQNDYFELIEYCKNFGDVLTEHVGSNAVDNIGEHKSDKHIYLRDVNWIKDADVIIADITIASLGVGYELGFAESLNKNILCVYDARTNKNISAMLVGNDRICCMEYRDLDEAKEIIFSFLKLKYSHL